MPNYFKGTLYQIMVKGNLDPKWADWFEGLTLESRDGETLFRGWVADQAALHGMLSKINNLGLPLVLVAQVDHLHINPRCPLCGHRIDLIEES